LKDGVASALSSIYTAISSINNNLSLVISYLNPLSENFFLKLAFLPSQEYLSNYATQYRELFDSKFTVLSQIDDSISAFNQAIESASSGEWQGIKIDLTRYGAGELSIVSSEAINYYSQKIKFWLSAFMYFITALFVVKRVSTVLGAGR